jgi:polyhydroxybutyrate depolymerase
MGVNMYNACNPSHPTPTIHIHGTSDPINPYNGNSTSKAIEDVSLFWANQNGCDTIPVIQQVADSDPTDDATAEWYVYGNGINGHTVEHFKITDGGHTWPGQYVFTLLGNTCMDFSASNEIWRFFNQHQLTSVAEHESVEAEVWPNPVSGELYIAAGGHSVTSIIIMDMQGRVVEEQVKENIRSIDLSHLTAGCYIAKISGDGFYAMKKLVVAAE